LEKASSIYISCKSKMRQFSLLIKVEYYRLKNTKKKKIFLYTDSRGFDISQSDYKKKPFGFYTGDTIKEYCVDSYFCPEKHTTIIDFIKKYEEINKEYDAVIAHIGIVDFSPRHQAVALHEIYPLKKKWYDNIFGEEGMKEHLNSDFGISYEGDKTINMFSLDMAEKYLIPYLNKIPNLIFIGCNNLVKGWEGNYFKKRPENIFLLEEYSKVFCSKLQNTIDLTSWDDEDVMKYTYDNIHLTKKGGEILFGKIKRKISDIHSSF